MKQYCCIHVSKVKWAIISRHTKYPWLLETVMKNETTNTTELSVSQRSFTSEILSCLQTLLLNKHTHEQTTCSGRGKPQQINTRATRQDLRPFSHLLPLLSPFIYFLCTNYSFSFFLIMTFILFASSFLRFFFLFYFTTHNTTW